MDISYKWLKRFITVNGTPKELAATLTSLGLECDNEEEIPAIPGGLKGVVIGRVLTCEAHPNSDHLHITTVDLGGDAPVQIVCGAPNVAAGQTVAVATVGTTLFDDQGNEFKIKKSKIRGVESLGMICAEDELHIGTGHDGIMVLDASRPEARPGTPAAEYFHLESDYRLEVELTPNRVDAASHLGVARDLRAHGHACPPALSMPDDKLPEPCGEPFTTIVVENTEACPRYCGITVRGVKVGPSPEWLCRLLEAAGQRPINNIVDITNFVLLGLGQPLHCFDLSTVDGGRIVVRNCPEGTPFTTLDGVEHKLSSADLMICSATRPLCIAGVFGGLDSGVTEKTTDVFIESAYFNPTSIRRTARRHGLSTDASFRYERGTDPNILPYAARVAAAMIVELAGGHVCGPADNPVLDTRPEGFEPFAVQLDLDYMDRLIGKAIPRAEVVEILSALDIEICPASTERMLELRVPRYRVDVTRPCDVVEEVLRVYGYNNVEFGDELHASLSQLTDTDFSYALQQRVADSLSGLGWREIMTNSLTAVDYYDGNVRWPRSGAVEVINPLSRDLTLLRRTLLYGGLEAIARNVNRRSADLLLYEYGNVYSVKGERTDYSGYREEQHLGLWVTGHERVAGWDRPETEASFAYLKGVVEQILVKAAGRSARFSVKQETALPVQEGECDPLAARLVITGPAGQAVGYMAMVDHALLQRMDIDQPVCFAELSWPAIYGLRHRRDNRVSELEKTLPVRRDLALLVDKEVSFDSLRTAMEKVGGRQLRSVTLFDVYEGKGVPDGKKSYAIALELQDAEKTLTDKQIEATVSRLLKALQPLGATLR